MAGDDFRTDENCFGLVLWRSIGMDRDAVPDGEFETVSVDRCQPVPFGIIDDDLIVGLSGALSEYVSANVGETGSYENVSEYIRDLIRRDKERTEQQAFERLKAELTRAFAAPDSSYAPLSAADVIARNQA